jgi:hypothetical protein
MLFSGDDDTFRVAIADVYPRPSAALAVRLRMWAERVIAKLLARLQLQAEESLKSAGYRKGTA